MLWNLENEVALKYETFLFSVYPDFRLLIPANLFTIKFLHFYRLV